MTNQQRLICPHCQNDDETLIDFISHGSQAPRYAPIVMLYYCNNCAKTFEIKDEDEITER